MGVDLELWLVDSKVNSNIWPIKAELRLPRRYELLSQFGSLGDTYPPPKIETEPLPEKQFISYHGDLRDKCGYGGRLASMAVSELDKIDFDIFVDMFTKFRKAEGDRVVLFWR